jgi:spore maturation protein CgeB
MAGAAATLNIHGDQDGFTMRTFEASGVGALQLIDRSDVARHYEPGVEILPFSSVAEIVDLVGRAHRDPYWAARVRAAARDRTLAEHTFAHRARDLEEMWG